FRTDQQPIHAEEAERRGVEKEIDDLVLPKVAFAREGEGIDAEEGLVIGGADVAFELGDQPRAPGARRLQPGEAFIQQPFVHDRGHGSPPSGKARLAAIRHPRERAMAAAWSASAMSSSSKGAG